MSEEEIDIREFAEANKGRKIKSAIDTGVVAGYQVNKRHIIMRVSKGSVGWQAKLKHHNDVIFQEYLDKDAKFMYAGTDHVIKPKL